MHLVSVELRVTVAGVVCIQLQHRWAAKSLAGSCREDLVLQGPEPAVCYLPMACVQSRL